VLKTAMYGYEPVFRDSCRIVCHDGSRCANTPARYGMCRWHLIARSLSNGRVRSPENIALWRWGLAAVTITGFVGALWQWLKGPCLVSFWPLPGMVASGLVSVTMISCFTANCRPLWPRILAISAVCFGALTAVSGLLFAFWPTVFYATFTGKELASVPPRLLYSATLFCMGLFFFLWALRVIFLLRIHSGILKALWITGLFSILIENLSSKSPVGSVFFMATWFLVVWWVIFRTGKSSGD
jgi:hypothetical protein